MAKTTDKLLTVKGQLSRQEKPIEVVIGNVIDPANFHMVFKSEMEGITRMEKVLGEKVPGHNQGLKHLKVGKSLKLQLKRQLGKAPPPLTPHYQLPNPTQDCHIHHTFNHLSLPSQCSHLSLILPLLLTLASTLVINSPRNLVSLKSLHMTS